MIKKNNGKTKLYKQNGKETPTQTHTPTCTQPHESENWNDPADRRTRGNLLTCRVLMYKKRGNSKTNRAREREGDGELRGGGGENIRFSNQEK